MHKKFEEFWLAPSFKASVMHNEVRDGKWRLYNVVIAYDWELVDFPAIVSTKEETIPDLMGRVYPRILPDENGEATSGLYTCYYIRLDLQILPVSDYPTIEDTLRWVDQHYLDNNDLYLQMKAEDERPGWKKAIKGTDDKWLDESMDEIIVPIRTSPIR